MRIAAPMLMYMLPPFLSVDGIGARRPLLGKHLRAWASRRRRLLPHG
jgi:hypothetical protein